MILITNKSLIASFAVYITGLERCWNSRSSVQTAADRDNFLEFHPSTVIDQLDVIRLNYFDNEETVFSHSPNN